MHIHILGICGTLMGSIALLAKEAGHKVSGMDQNVYPPMSTQLESAGIQFTAPYSAGIPTSADLVIMGNAGLARGNPAVEAVLNQGIRYVSGPEWLGRYLLPDRQVIAVAGTHGKTTTTSMIAWILEQAGMRPGFLIGGIPVNFDQSARLGDDPFFVIEADEYDTSFFDRQSKFLHYFPQTVVVNNLEYDHADIFPDLESIQYQFHLLMRRIPASGQVIYPIGDTHVKEVIDKGCWSEQVTISGADADIDAEHVKADGSAFTVKINKTPRGNIQWSQTGMYNVHNALAAIAAARHAGVTPETACTALCAFKGVKRRMELIYSTGSLKVYDDFAHHPTAIAGALAGLRAHAGTEKILVVIDPASHTMRLGTHAQNLNAAVTDADYILWHQPDNIRWDMARYLQGDNKEIIGSVDDMLDRCELLIDSIGVNHLVIMSNGGFGGFHRRLIERLQPQAHS